MNKRSRRVANKAEMLRLMANELCDNIEDRESMCSSLGTYPSYGELNDGQSKMQILADIRKCRRTLLEISKLVEKE